MIGFILGEFYTDAYGNANEQSGSVLDNDNQNIGLVSVFVGPKECEMVSLFPSLFTKNTIEEDPYYDILV